MPRCFLTQENDEYACSCGLRWEVGEEDPHKYLEKEMCELVKKKMYNYAVTVEVYREDGKFMGRALRYCEAPHCSVAAQVVERAEKNVFAIDVVRQSEVVDANTP